MLIIADVNDNDGMEMGSTQSDDDSNGGGDGSEFDSEDDEGGDTEQLCLLSGHSTGSSTERTWRTGHTGFGSMIAHIHMTLTLLATHGRDTCDTSMNTLILTGFVQIIDVIYWEEVKVPEPCTALNV
eukprot:scaffold60957_cov37-Cyclotella_meneghiniana.AAC.1